MGFVAFERSNGNFFRTFEGNNDHPVSDRSPRIKNKLTEDIIKARPQENTVLIGDMLDLQNFIEAAFTYEEDNPVRHVTLLQPDFVNRANIESLITLHAKDSKANLFIILTGNQTTMETLISRIQDLDHSV